MIRKSRPELKSIEGGDRFNHFCVIEDKLAILYSNQEIIYLAILRVEDMMICLLEEKEDTK